MMPLKTTTQTRMTHETFATLTAVSLAMTFLGLAWALTEVRVLDGSVVWEKPTKFAVSFAVHFGTLALIVAALPPGLRALRSVRWTAGIMAVIFLAETYYVTLQAALAQRSHFNAADSLHAALYNLMGLGAVLLIIGPVIVANVARKHTGFGSGTRSGIWAGALFSFVLTLIIAGYLGSTQGHFVGVPTADARALPFFGWSAQVGDLRPAHFFALHALQALPLVGIWLDRSGRPARLVWVAAGLWAVLTMALFVQALMGLPLIALR